MSLRRSSCRILSWLLRAGKVRMGPPRLSLPPANKHMHTLRHQGEDTAPEARGRPASPPPAQPKRPLAGPPARGGCPRTLSPSFSGSVPSLLQFYGWREKGSRSRASFALNLTSSHPSLSHPLRLSASLCLSVSLSLSLSSPAL